ncbi:IS21 family transposase [Roseateles sp. 22389]|uniref:IS21 family transposase n=1 Tax=Roseateles sp. 22389 TaxID=3453916 RepID=UPI003F847911
MRKIREVLRLSHSLLLSRRAVAASLDISRDAVGDYLLRAANARLTWPLPEDINDEQLERLLYPVEPTTRARRPEPNWADIHREMQLPGATLQQLHSEYLRDHPDGMQRSNFCALYRKWCRGLKSYLRQSHQAGDKVFVDYAGPTVAIHDAASGSVQRAQIFVGVLGASNYCYAEAHWSQKLPDWIAAHVRMLEFFGGVPNAIVCDNLKSGVTRPSLTEPLINDSYQNFAQHYGTTILPARSRHPKDKSKVEGHVLIVERWILFRLRRRVFTSLSELNDAIRELLVDLNGRPFQKLPGSRASAFASLDRPHLRSLPATPYEYVEFRRARVGMDKMVTVAGRLYSVPAKFVSQVVDVRVTAGAVEVLFGGRRVASHAQTPGIEPVIDPAHLTPAEHAYGLWSPDRELQWAAEIGPQTTSFVEQRLTASGGKTAGYRLGLGMRKLSAEFGTDRLEAACAKAISNGATSVSSLRAILVHRLDTFDGSVTEANFVHENLRGPEHYH